MSIKDFNERFRKVLINISKVKIVSNDVNTVFLIRQMPEFLKMSGSTQDRNIKMWLELQFLVEVILQVQC